MMAAAAAAAERDGGPGSSPVGSPRPPVDHSVLVVVGALRPAGLLERLLRQVDSGVRCWPVDLQVSVLDQQLKLFVSRHSAFLSEDVPGKYRHAPPRLTPEHHKNTVCVCVCVCVCERQTAVCLIQTHEHYQLISSLQTRM
nr:microtubule-associated protein 1B-like [Labrus bergylta]